ncbi:hypothetical protein MKX01_021310 [Papaver californicum]|nr:hypothetical protein MKX01_021310 [Papaver californicum]
MSITSLDLTRVEFTNQISSKLIFSRFLVPFLFRATQEDNNGFRRKHRRLLGIGKSCATYATNAAIITGFYCGAREFGFVLVLFLETKKESLLGDSQNPDKNWLKLPEWSPIQILAQNGLVRNSFMVKLSQLIYMRKKIDHS